MGHREPDLARRSWSLAILRRRGFANGWGVRFDMLEQEGFVLDRVTGSHHVFTKDETTFVVPVHNNQVKTIYVKRAIELIESSEIPADDEEIP
jgi:predicted RNA binding protein YcfA (HicA-like mRNA interferase family)